MLKISAFVPVLSHNLSNYYSHLFCETSINREEHVKIDGLAITKENSSSFDYDSLLLEDSSRFLG